MESLFSREKLYRYKLRMFSFCKQLTVGETCENVLFTKTKRNAVTFFLSLQTWIPGANGKRRNYFIMYKILHGSRHFCRCPTLVLYLSVALSKLHFIGSSRTDGLSESRTYQYDQSRVSRNISPAYPGANRQEVKHSTLYLLRIIY